MEKYLALIKNNLVEGIIVADDSFIKHIESKYDHIVDVTDISRPSAGDSYYSDTKTFISNTQHKHDLSVDLTSEHLQKGTESGFEPFHLSQYLVKYEGGMVHIGCKQYTPAGLLDAAHQVLINQKKSPACFTVLSDGPTHGKFGITWEDTQKLYDALIKVKF